MGADPATGRLPLVGILLFEGVEVLDFAGPFEVFCAARPVGQHGGETPLFRVVTVAEDDGPVRCEGGLSVVPAATIEADLRLDIAVVPGGPGARLNAPSPRLKQWLVRQNEAGGRLASVCTGTFLLAAAGLLAGRQVTTHWNRAAEMRRRYPAVRVLEDARIVEDGRLVSCGGIASGIDLALHLVAQRYGGPVADWTARRLDYRGWPVAAAGVRLDAHSA